MKYTKPQIQCLANAVKLIQSGEKGTDTANDASFPKTTVSAYEADE
jgi:hypothetical protein